MFVWIRTLKDTWKDDQGTAIRTLDQIELLELTVTSNPAYLQTQVDVRSCPQELRSLLNGSKPSEADIDEELWKLRMQVEILKLK